MHTLWLRRQDWDGAGLLPFLSGAQSWNFPSSWLCTAACQSVFSHQLHVVEMQGIMLPFSQAKPQQAQASSSPAGSSKGLQIAAWMWTPSKQLPCQHPNWATFLREAADLLAAQFWRLNLESVFWFGFCFVLVLVFAFILFCFFPP